VKRILAIIGALLLLIVLAAIALPFLINPNQYRPLLESQLSGALGREVKIGGLKLELLKGSVSAGDLSISEDPAFGTKPFLKAQSLHVGIELRPLIFERKLNVTQVTIEKPEVRIAASEKGQWNFASLGKKPGGGAQTPGSSGGSGMDVSLKQVRIADGQIVLARPGQKDQELRDIDIDLQDLSLTSPLSFQVAAKRPEGGSIKVEGKAGPLNASGELPPVDARFEVPALDLNASGLVDRSTGMGGVASLRGTIKVKGDIAQLNGDLKAEKLKLVPRGTPASRPVQLSFSVSHDVARRTGRITRADIHIGKAEASMEGTYSLAGKVPSFALRFHGDKMPLTELAAMLPAFDVVLPVGATLEAGTLTMSTTVAGTPGSFSAIGPLEIADAKLANYDLGTKMKVIEMLAGIPGNPSTEVRTLSANVKHTPDGTLIDAINMVVPAIGNLTGSGTISDENALDFKMRTTLHTSGTIMQAAGQKGDTTIPFLITGNASNPVFKPDVKTLAKEKVQQLTKDPAKTIEAAKSIFDMFRKPKQ
jgi:AsmA protein